VTATDLPGTAGEEYAEAAEHRPLAGYAALSGTLAAALAAGLVKTPLPERIRAQDIVLAGVATHKLSRLIAKDKVTSFVRAPFTEFQEPSGKGEIEEKPRGRGLRLATGELLVCPYCVAQWIAAGFAVGYVRAPRLTRLLAGMYTMYAISDGLQFAYLAADEKT
jgi:Protein of unknown function (DUF1360)